MNPPPSGKTIGTWRVEPLPPELSYASSGAIRARTHSGFGRTSLLLGCALALGVTAIVVYALPSKAEDADRIAVSTLPVCFVGAAFGIVGAVRRSKRRLPGVVGILINVAVGLVVALLWLVNHVAT